CLAVVMYVLPSSVTHMGRSMPYLNGLLNERAYGADGLLLRGEGPLLLGRLARAALTAAAIPGAALLLFAALVFAVSLWGRGVGEYERSAALLVGVAGRETGATDGCRMREPDRRDAARDLVFLQWVLQFAFIAGMYHSQFERYYLLLLAPAFLLLA